jgi:hypothetical protein
MSDRPSINVRRSVCQVTRHRTGALNTGGHPGVRLGERLRSQAPRPGRDPERRRTHSRTRPEAEPPYAGGLRRPWPMRPRSSPQEFGSLHGHALAKPCPISRG